MLRQVARILHYRRRHAVAQREGRDGVEQLCTRTCRRTNFSCKPTKIFAVADVATTSKDHLVRTMPRVELHKSNLLRV